MATPGFETGPALGPLTLYVGNDPAELAALLPPKARKRFEILCLRRDDSHKLIPAAETMRALGAEKFGLERAIEKMQARRPEGDFLPDEDLRVVSAKSRLVRLTNEVQAIRERYETRGQAFAAIARTHADAMDWIRNRPPNTVIEDAAEPKLNGKVPLLDQLENVRRRGRELTSDLNRIRSSCYPSEHCKRRMVEIVNGLAERRRPSMALLVEHDRPEIGWPQLNLQSKVFNAQVPSFAAVETTDTLTLFCWLHRDQLIAAFDGEIDQEADDQNALDPSERQVRESEVLGDIVENDRVESALMFAGWADGISITPRPDLAPAALLNVLLVTVPPRFGSSAERAGYDIVGPR